MEGPYATAPDPGEIEGRAECCRLGADIREYVAAEPQFQRQLQIFISEALPDQNNRFQAVARLILQHRAAREPSYPRSAHFIAEREKWEAKKRRLRRKESAEAFAWLNKDGRAAGPIPQAALRHGKRGLQIPLVARSEYQTNARLLEVVRTREAVEASKETGGGR